MNNHNSANPGTITTLSMKLTQLVSQVKVDESTRSDMLPQGVGLQIR